MKIYNYTLTIILLLAFSLEIKAQDMNSFYFEANVANNLAKVGKIDSAIAIYENAFKKIDYVHITYLKKLVKLAKLNKDKERINRYEKQIKTQFNGTNSMLATIVDSLIDVDQGFRTKKSYKKLNYYYKCMKDSFFSMDDDKFIVAKEYHEQMLRTDSSNISCLLNLFEKYGYLGEELVGLKKGRAIAVFIILLHFDIDTNSTVLEPVLEKALNKGEISPLYFTQIIDRHLFFHTGVQKYWTWPCFSKTGKLPLLVTDIPKIIELRESIGLYSSEPWQEKKGKFWVLRNKFN